MSDPINPDHYRKPGFELADVIDAFDLDRWETQVVKYVMRARHKGGLEDFKKARWYLERIISRGEIQQALASQVKSRGVPRVHRRRRRARKETP